MLIRVPRNVVFIFLLTCIAIGSAAYYSYKNIELTSRSGKLVSTTKETLFLIEGVQSQTTNLEETAKQVILTGNNDFLDDYDSTQQQLTQSVASLKELIKDNPAQEKNIRSLELHVRKESKIVDSALLIRAFSAANARIFLATGNRKDNIEEINALLANMKEIENNLLIYMEEENSKATYKSVQAIILSAGVAFMLILWLLYLLNSDISKRKKAERLALENEKNTVPFLNM